MVKEPSGILIAMKCLIQTFGGPCLDEAPTFSHTHVLTKIISKLQAGPVLLHHHLSKQLLIMYTFLNQSRIEKSWEKYSKQ